MTPSAEDGPVVVREAYAKVNLSLDVGLRRPDGYHDVRTVMQTISLYDTLTVTRTSRPGIRLRVEPDGAPRGPDNLVWRAAELFLNRTGIPRAGLDIRLIKRIPAQAGLGGGSSDAAAALMALRELFPNACTAEQLHAMAAALGSDVAFFLQGGTALMEGRGEIGRQLPPAPELHLVVVKPPQGISTAQAYRALDAIPGRVPGTATEAVLKALDQGDAPALLGAMGNDFEQVLAELCPASEAAIRDLRHGGALTAHLCGSGSAVFGVVPSLEAAQEVARSLRNRWKEVTVCRTVSMP